MLVTVNAIEAHGLPPLPTDEVRSRVNALQPLILAGAVKTTTGCFGFVGAVTVIEVVATYCHLLHSITVVVHLAFSLDANIVTESPTVTTLLPTKPGVITNFEASARNTHFALESSLNINKSVHVKLLV